uniref:Uncharacterized protein n=1 Tax=Anguilla anguilla TaxID=7936 RepID=A0A0E9TQ64_ANGAN
MDLLAGVVLIHATPALECHSISIFPAWIGDRVPHDDGMKYNSRRITICLLSCLLVLLAK